VIVKALADIAYLQARRTSSKIRSAKSRIQSTQTANAAEHEVNTNPTFMLVQLCINLK